MKPYYEDEWATIYHGKCERMVPGTAADVVITDPPYGVDFRGEGWDREIPEVAFRLPSMYDRALIVTGTLTLWDYPPPKWVLCWGRPASSSRSLAGGFNHWSPVLLYGDIKFPVDFKSWHAIANAYGPGFGHPSPKPYVLMAWLVTHGSAEGETILDPFMGSGTTLLAAKNLGRKAIGIEQEERYCELAASRLSQGVLDLGAA